MNKYMLFLLIFVAFASCQNRFELSSDDLVKYETVDTININYNIEIKQQLPRFVSVIADYVIVTNSNGEFFFQVYNKHSLELIGFFGRKGRGPNEYIYPRLIKAYRGQNDILVDIYDSRNRKYCIVQLNKAIEDHSYIPEIEILPNEVFSPEEIIYKNQDTLIYTPDNSFENSRFSFYNYSTNKIKRIPFLPELENGVSTINCYPIYNTISSLYMPERREIALTSSMMGQVDFFDLQGKYIESKIIERQEQLQHSGSDNLINEYNPIRYQSEIRQKENGIFLMLTKYSQFNEYSFSEFYSINRNSQNNKKIITNKVCMSFDIDNSTNYFYILYYENERFYLSRQKIYND